MPSYRFLIDEVEEGASGPKIAAFFDMDRTLIYGFSAQDLLVEQIATGELSVGGVVGQASQAVQFARGKIDFAEMVNATAKHLRGQVDSRNYEFGRRVFEKRVASRIYPEARLLIDAHLKKGHVVVIVSAATPYQVEPVANDLGVHSFLCTHLEVKNGICTGKVLEPACYGEGKSVAVRNFVADRDIDLAESYFYTDGNEDLPLLEIVGKPRPLNPDKKLTSIAKSRDWHITRFEGRGRTSAKDVARTGLAYLSAAPAAAAALSAYSLNGSARQARNIFQGLWGELSSAAIGLDLDVEGQEHLWSHRPAVFMANHQSAVDAIAVLKLVQSDFTAIAKKEIQSQPVIGQMSEAMGTIFVDRSDNKSAREALQPAVTALKGGTSIIIFPEGTRSPTNKLSKFKKGGFHLAMQAGVPIVPIVLKNTTDAMPKGAIMARPATVHVTVLPPVETKDWEIEDLDANIDIIRNQFLVELEQGGGDAPNDVIRLAQSGNKPNKAADGQGGQGSKSKKTKG
jgi:putative phosphoserine phosphatase / 1-acylglycerol-3-phosphate O-acyltransferase